MANNLESVKEFFYAIIGIAIIGGLIYFSYYRRGITEKCVTLTKDKYRLIDNSTLEKICECSLNSLDLENPYRGIITLEQVARGIEDYDHGNIVANMVDSDRHECVIKALAKAGISVYELSKMNKD